MDSRGIWVLLMMLVGYGSNGNRLRLWEKVDWMVCHSDCKQQYTNFPILSDKESVIVSPAVIVHTLLKNKKIKSSVSVLAMLLSSLVPWGSLNWLNGWGRKKVFCVDCWNGCTQKLGGEKLLNYRGREC